MKDTIEAIYNWYKTTIRNPKYRWWIIGGSLLYLLSPIDIAPDFIPVIGWIDDGVIATILVAELSQMLLTRLRSSKETEAAQTPPSAEAPTNPSGTVDVNAISIE